MDSKKKPKTEVVEQTMACSAFAEAGEPCPIGAEKQQPGGAAAAKKEAGSIAETMACAAFAEAGEPCPIDSKEEKNENSAK